MGATLHPWKPLCKSPQVIYYFDKYSLDGDLRELRRETDLVPVEPQVFDLLQHLIRHRDRVVSSDDLIATIWKGRVVSPSTLGSRMAAVRRAVGDSGEQQRMIVTLPRRGHRFVGEVHEDARSGRGALNTGAQPALNNAPMQTQAVTFCKTKDGINLAIAAVGEGPILVRTTHWLSHIEYDWSSQITSPVLHALGRVDI